jgi:hypothetical protein
MAIGLLLLGQIRLLQAMSEQNEIIVTRLWLCSRRMKKRKKRNKI